MAELEVEGQNITVVDNVSNASNLTGREAATPEGIAVTYFSLFLMALGPIFLGSLRSVKHHLSLKVTFTRIIELHVFNIHVNFAETRRGGSGQDRHEGRCHVSCVCQWRTIWYLPLL